MYSRCTHSLGLVDGLDHVANSAGLRATRLVASLTGLWVMENVAKCLVAVEARQERATRQFPLPSGRKETGPWAPHIQICDIQQSILKKFAVFFLAISF